MKISSDGKRREDLTAVGDVAGLVVALGRTNSSGGGLGRGVHRRGLGGGHWAGGVGVDGGAGGLAARGGLRGGAGGRGRGRGRVDAAGADGRGSRGLGVLLGDVALASVVELDDTVHALEGDLVSPVTVCSALEKSTS